MMLRLWLALIDRDRETLVRQWILAGFRPAYLSRLTPAMLEDAVALSLAATNGGGPRRQIDLALAVDIRAGARRDVPPTRVVGCRQAPRVPPAHARDRKRCVLEESFSVPVVYG